MVRSSRPAAVVILSVVLGIACLALARSRRAHAESARAVATPFTLKTESYGFSNGALGEIGSSDLTARRADGTTVTVSTAFPGKPYQRSIRVVRYLDGRQVRLVDAIAAKTMLFSQKDVAWRNQRLLNPSADCVFANYENLIGKDAVLGHAADVVSTSFTGTVWRAPDLGCETVQSREGYKHNGGFMLEAETRAISLKLGEPDPRLFDEGKSYAELKPSDLLRREMASVGIPWDDNLQQHADRDDKLYYSKR
jgi:hypothetical protein